LIAGQRILAGSVGLANESCKGLQKWKRKKISTSMFSKENRSLKAYQKIPAGSAGLANESCKGLEKWKRKNISTSLFSTERQKLQSVPCVNQKLYAGNVRLP